MFISDKEKKSEIINCYNDYKARVLLLGNESECILIDDLFYVLVDSDNKIVLYGINKEKKDLLNSYFDVSSNTLILPDIFDIIKNLSYVDEFDIRDFLDNRSIRRRLLLACSSIYSKSIHPLEYPDIRLGDSVEIIEDDVFYGWKVYHIGENNFQVLGNHCFDGSQIVEIINNKAKYISSNSFHDCSNLKKVELPNVTYFGDYVFSGCDNLEYVRLGSLSQLPDKFFSDLKNLRTVDGTSSCILVGKSCFQNTKVEELDLRNCSNISESAFENSSLRKIKVSNKLKFVGENAFKGVKNTFFDRFVIEYYSSNSHDNHFENITVNNGNASFLNAKIKVVYT